MVKLEEYQIEDICKRYESGESPYRIEKDYPVSEPAIRSLLKTRGYYKPKAGGHTWKEDIGKRYAKLVVLNRIDNGKAGHIRYKCICDCGKEFNAYANNIRKNITRSCGCSNITGGVKRSGEMAYNRLYSSYMNGAKSRDYSFNLSKEEFKKLLHENCYYCGEEPSRLQYAYHRTRYSESVEADEVIIVNGLDRLDNTKGYTLDNSVPCCKYCNYAKNDLSVTEFNARVKRIYDNLKLGE